MGTLDLPSSADFDTQMLQDMNLDLDGNTMAIDETEILSKFEETLSRKRT